VESDSARLLLGGRYHLGRVLGRGGVATVFEAADVVLGRVVAVKCFRLGSNASSVYRFGMEARLLANLSHPGLVTVHDVCLEGDEPYLVMQLVTGTTLREVIDEGPLPPKAVARLGARLAEVLAYVHSCDVMHRDLKPSNVLVDDSGASYLTDFGLARALSAAHLTASDEFVGTAAYLAPEQVTSADTGPPGDIYSLGLILLECLTGQPEYTGTTAEVALARLSRPPRVPHSLGSGWRTVLTAMTEKDPADRPTAARCVELLDALANGQVPLAAPARRTWPVRIGLAAAGLAAGAALVVPAVLGPTSIPGRPAGGPTPAPATGALDPAEPAGAADTAADPAESTGPAGAGASADDAESASATEPAGTAEPSGTAPPARAPVVESPVTGSPPAAPEQAAEQASAENGRDKGRGRN
jgi:hypothetical protein